MASNYKRKGKAKFIMIDGYVKRSLAWKDLTPIERNAYLEVKWRYDGLNNGRIGLGVRELAEELNMGNDTASRSLKALVAHGFIVNTKASAFNVKNRAVAEWRLTEYKCDVTGELPTKEFMRWEPKKKTQSHPSDTQSHASDCDHKKEGQKGPHSRTHRTVKPVSDISQSHPSDTYRYTIGEGTDEQRGLVSQHFIASLKRQGWVKPEDFPANQKAGEAEGVGTNIFLAAKGGTQ
ncbi:MAG: hypothetical protein IH622_03685 [Ochrobactrum anthropi]|uniref:Helix-turn-helix domain-containing protein n=1 Tax=Brucella anthropi TaxID=529 RepID=A0A8I0T968_BRUAN|nr:hypothetical protein [Brucella anthropi]MBE0559921.1 hypothetical protein [Brucella anthropi]